MKVSDNTIVGGTGGIQFGIDSRVEASFRVQVPALLRSRLGIAAAAAFHTFVATWRALGKEGGK